MSIYTGNGHRKNNAKRHLEFIASDDLDTWEPAFDSPEIRSTLGNFRTSEAAFDFDRQGNIFGTIRSIIHPNLNFFASSADSSQWKINIDRFKCDGPRLFCNRDQNYLIARRSLFYDLQREPFKFLSIFRNILKIIMYSLSRKRTAIYTFDREKLEIKHIKDLPSHGDTGYSAVAKMSDNEYLLVYYSSDISTKEDFTWLRGQIGRTNLYSSILTIN